MLLEPRGDGSGVRVLRPGLQRALFILSSLDAATSIIADPGRPDKSASSPRIAMPRLFGLRFFAPRVLFTIGAMARGLQMSTGLAGVFDPGFGVTGLVNAGAVWVNAKWLPKLVLGWVASGCVWLAMGAEDPGRRKQR